MSSQSVIYLGIIVHAKSKKERSFGSTGGELSLLLGGCYYGPGEVFLTSKESQITNFIGFQVLGLRHTIKAYMLRLGLCELND